MLGRKSSKDSRQISNSSPDNNSVFHADASGIIAVTGAAGMLGRDVQRELHSRGLIYHACDRGACDITSPDSCSELFSQNPAIKAVINCAAYTDVNRAESEEELATLINGRGAENLANACKAAGARLIHVSTDYVFDGTKPEPYAPADSTNPLNAYGRSKLAGEHAITAILPADQYAIVRTSWLYGQHGPNFVKTMLKLAGEKRDLKVINDQTGAPTYTADLSRALVDIALTPAVGGIVHATNTGWCTWYEFAQAIFEESGVQPRSVSPCASADFLTPAVRPANSRLSPDRLTQLNIKPLPPWRDALRRYLLEPAPPAAP